MTSLIRYLSCALRYVRTMWRCNRHRQILALCAVLVIVFILVQKVDYFSLSETTALQALPIAAESKLSTTVQSIAHLIGKLRRRNGVGQEIPVDSEDIVTTTTSIKPELTTLSSTLPASTNSASAVETTPTSVSTTTMSSSTAADTTQTVTDMNTQTTTLPVSVSSSKASTSFVTNGQRSTVLQRITKKRRKALKFTKKTKEEREIQYIRESEIKPEDKELMMDLLNTLWKVKRENNFTMFLYGGTLIGSWRHHGFIPYDDDVDIVASYSIYNQLYEALNRLKPNYIVVKSGYRQKFYSIKSKYSTAYWWKWPYVDLQFYQESDTHIWDASSEFRSYKYLKKDTFPLKLRPFEGNWYEAPFNTLNFLTSYYGSLDMCETGYYSHKFEKGQQKHAVACDSLKPYYPFVERTTVNGTMIETLQFNGKVLSEVAFVVKR